MGCGTRTYKTWDPVDPVRTRTYKTWDPVDLVRTRTCKMWDPVDPVRTQTCKTCIKAASSQQRGSLLCPQQPYLLLKKGTRLQILTRTSGLFHCRCLKAASSQQRGPLLCPRLPHLLSKIGKPSIEDRKILTKIGVANMHFGRKSITCPTEQ